MQSKRDSALKVAEFLLQVKAVKLQPENPFTWASGWKSPIYCDNRVTLSYPKIRTFIRQNYVDAILENFGKPDVIAGVATGGIAQGALIAQELGVPFVYVRSSTKGHGMQNMIEGHLESGQSVVVIEDLVSTGKSSLLAVDALRASNASIKGMAAIFTYGFERAKEAFEKADVQLVTLTDYSNLIKQAVKAEYIDQKEVESLENWRVSPETWGQ
ncbi:orotate phosphoribosyltransferase [Cryomorpha ignava]|uniref:Orotate phosphoribosyltransferase n=1 Tax=Cryomorpha ignava TaxID=101383 RepID=A0A7K3WLA4_9FLAO|nr:orotate phosphoribosyltransferase [Cryomorpha ignava]NEN22409.1 orotate phosphoribosyltransferase [Cryomorpha ignava]